MDEGDGRDFRNSGANFQGYRDLGLRVKGCFGTFKTDSPPTFGRAFPLCSDKEKSWLHGSLR